MTSHVGMNASVDPGQITGLTTRGGAKLPFHTAGATIEGDTLYAVGSAGQIVVATSEVQSLWVTQVSFVRTASLVAGFVVLGAYVFGGHPGPAPTGSPPLTHPD